MNTLRTMWPPQYTREERRALTARVLAGDAEAFAIARDWQARQDVQEFGHVTSPTGQAPAESAASPR